MITLPPYQSNSLYFLSKSLVKKWAYNKFSTFQDSCFITLLNFCLIIHEYKCVIDCNVVSKRIQTRNEYLHSIYFNLGILSQNKILLIII